MHATAQLPALHPLLSNSTRFARVSRFGAPNAAARHISLAASPGRSPSGVVHGLQPAGSCLFVGRHAVDRIMAGGIAWITYVVSPDPK
jgi:hypothetical protein